MGNNFRHKNICFALLGNKWVLYLCQYKHFQRKKKENYQSKALSAGLLNGRHYSDSVVFVKFNINIVKFLICTLLQ